MFRSLFAWNIFLSFHPKTVFIFGSKMCFLEASERRILFSNPICWSVSFDEFRSLNLSHWYERYCWKIYIATCYFLDFVWFGIFLVFFCLKSHRTPLILTPIVPWAFLSSSLGRSISSTILCRTDLVVMHSLIYFSSTVLLVCILLLRRDTMANATLI